MKKKIIAITTVGLMLFGAGAASASVYELTSSEASIKQDVANQFKKDQTDMQFQLQNDTSSVTQEQINTLKNDTMKYYETKKAAYYQSQLNTKTNEIVDTRKQMETELQKYVDSLFKGE